MPAEASWMPVFVVVEARKAVHAAHPDHKGKVGPAKGAPSQDFEQRIGTAHRQEDGSYVVKLTAVPVTGRLIIRPPRQGEHLDPTSREN
jgi:hypothetical protein